ncbi:unnamed protein product [Notodromas monacha]|uniref:Uncharacterized protein n=1 Tax=Notodromas monacha TaxID=399045 RepID=A0A7R9GGL1_9CRUS|nr:unnamed protein product [Notodromas monacha]CAG0921962.1 unnamed protein product [Notodromas monacha]
MSDTDLYGGPSTEELVMTPGGKGSRKPLETSTPIKAFSNRTGYPDPRIVTHRVTSNPALVMAGKRCWSLTDISSSCCDGFGDGEIMFRGVTSDKERLEKTMPNLEQAPDSSKLDAVKKIQQTILVYSYRKKKKRLLELTSQYQDLHSKYNKSLLMLKASKAEAEIERCSAGSYKKDFTCALSQLEEQQAVSRSLQEEIRKVSEESRECKDIMRLLKEESASKTVTVSELQLKLSSTTDSLLQTENNLSEHVQMMTTLKDQVAALTHNVTNLTSKVAALEEENTILQREVSLDEENLTRAKSTIADLAFKNEELNNSLVTTHEDNILLKRSIQKQQQEAEVFNRTIEDLNETLADVNASRDGISAMLDVLRAENQALKDLNKKHLQEVLEARSEAVGHKKLVSTICWLPGLLLKCVWVSLLPIHPNSAAAVNFRI